MINKLLKYIGWLDYRGRIDWAEINLDIVIMMLVLLTLWLVL